MTKKLHILIILFLIPFLGISQEEFLANLPIHGRTEGIGISDSEKIWIATKTGDTYYTEKIGELWHFGPFGSKNEMDYSSGQTFDRVNFLDENILMISGFIQENGKQDFVYRSIDDGKTWNKVRFGKSSWIDALYSNGEGKIWMSGSSQLIYYSEDYGETWKEFDKVETKGNLRFSTIHFSKNGSLGLFGSFWNVIYKTTDNCRTWEKLPTPLSQKKYSKVSKKIRPDIRKIRNLKNYYVVNQQGRIYYTKNDTVDWKLIPDIVDFEVTKFEKLYVINKDLSVSLLDNELQIVWTSKESLNSFPVDIKTKNGNLFAFTYSLIYKINQNEYIVSELLTNEVQIKEPYLKVNYKNENIGFSGSSILRYDKQNNAWFKYMTAAFQIANATVFENQIIISDNSLKSKYSVDIAKQKISKYTLPKKLFDLRTNSIVSIKFEIGSQGCFHFDNEFKKYKKKAGEFKLSDKSKGAFSGLPKKLNEERINDLVSEIDTSRFYQVSLSDLNFSQNDIEAFIELILREKDKMKKNGFDRFDSENYYQFPGENTDFEFYINVANNLDNIPNETINEVFNTGYGNWSTTTNWRTIIVEFEDKAVLTLSNSDDKPNYLYLPWTIEYKGLTLKSNSIELGRKINELTKSEMFDKKCLTKNYALFKITDFIYRKSLENQK